MFADPGVVTPETFPHGLRCARCGKVIPTATRYETELTDTTMSEIAAGAEEIVPIMTIICGACPDV